MSDLPTLDEPLYRALQAGKSAALALPDRAAWKVTGADRIRYLNGQVTNDVTRLKPGKSMYAAVLTGKGRLVGDLFLTAAPDEEALWLDAAGVLRESLRARFEKFLIADDVVFEDLTETGALSHWFGATTPPSAPGRIVSANARFGLPGFDVWQTGVPFLCEPIVPPALADLIRIEHGIGIWGRELDEQTLPQEVALERNERGLSYEKGCYVGQETVARLRSIGHVNRHLVLIEQIAGAPDAEPGPLQCEGVEAGKITSVADGLKGEIALAYIHRNFLNGAREFSAGERRYRIKSPVPA